MGKQQKIQTVLEKTIFAAQGRIISLHIPAEFLHFAMAQIQRFYSRGPRLQGLDDPFPSPTPFPPNRVVQAL